MKSDIINTLEKLHGKLPKIYYDCINEGITENHEYKTYSIELFSAENILSINVAPEDCEIDEMKPVALDGLIPIANLHDVDLWVLDNRRGGRVIRVPHDDNEAHIYAPSFEAWIYRLCLEEAADFPDEDEIVLRGLLRWGEFLSRYVKSWGEHLIKLSQMTLPDNAIGVIKERDLDYILKQEFKLEEIEGYVDFLRLEEF